MHRRFADDRYAVSHFESSRGAFAIRNRSASSRFSAARFLRNESERSEIQGYGFRCTV